MPVEHHRHTGGVGDAPQIQEAGIEDEAVVTEKIAPLTKVVLTPSTEPSVPVEGDHWLQAISDKLKVKAEAGVQIYHPFTETASDTLKHSNDTAVETSVNTLTLAKEILLSDDIKGCRIKFHLASTEEGQVVFGQIYKNDVAIGTSRNITTVAGQDYSEDFEDFVAGDKIQIYAKVGTESAGRASEISNMRLCYDIAVVPLVITIRDPNAAVSTQATTNKTPSAATLNGTALALGYPVATQHGFCYAETENPDLTKTVTQEGVPSLGAYTSDITGLTYSHTYYARAYITTPSGTFYGEQVEWDAEA